MSRVPWHLFQDRQPRAHLVVGAAEQAEGPVAGDELKAFHSLLTRLVAKQKPASDYAATLVRDIGRPAMYFAFEDQAAAQQFAAAVKAEATVSYPGWASQRAFELDGAKLAELEASLPLPRREKRRDPTDGSSLRLRVRRRPRTPVARYDEE